MKVRPLKIHGRFVALAATLATLATLVAPALAVIETWDGNAPQGGAGDSSISTGLNWADDTAPHSDLVNTGLIFAGTTKLAPVFDAAFRTDSITFNGTAGAFITSGSPITLGATGIINQDTQTQTITNTVVVGTAASKFEANNGAMAFGNTIALGANALDLGGAKDFTFYGPVTGKGKITKSGTGALTLTALPSLIDADFHLNAGTTTLVVGGEVAQKFSGKSNIAVNDSAVLSLNADTVLDGALLTRAASGDLVLAPGRTLTIQNGGDLTVTGGQTFPSTVPVNGGQSSPSTVTVTGPGSTLTTEGLALNANATLNILAGGAASAGPGWLYVGYPADGTIRVDGPGSNLTGGELRVGWGMNSTGRLLFDNKSTGTFGPVKIGDTESSDGIMVIDSGSTVTGTSLTIAPNAVAASGTLTITGAGSALKILGAATAAIGASSDSIAELRVENGGTFHSGTGLTNVNTTGSIAITAGAFNANGDLTLDGGTITQGSEGSFNLTAGKTLTIQKGGEFVIGGAYVHNSASTLTVTGAGSTINSDGALNFSGGSTLNVLAGGHVTSASGVFAGINPGEGTILVDGASSLLSGGGLLLAGTSTATFSHSSTGTFDTINPAVFGTAGTSGTLNIQSGAKVFGSQLVLADVSGATTGSVTVTGDGSTLTINGGLASTIGADNLSTATVQVKDGGLLNSSTGTMTVNPTGTIVVSDGTFHANGTLLLHGGQFTGNGPNALVIAPGRQMTVRAGGDAIFAGDFNQLTGAHLSVSGAGSTFTTGGSFRWVGAGSTPPVITVTDGGHLISGHALHLARNNSAVSLDVSGTGSQITAAASSTSEWQADVLLSSRASAILGSLRLADGFFSAPDPASLHVESGATASLGNIVAATYTAAGNRADITVRGPDSSVTQTGASTLTLGNAYSGSATLTAENGGTFTSGTGPVTLNATGAININDGAVNLKGPLTDNGGTLNFTGGALSIVNDFKVGPGGLLGDGDVTFAANRRFSTTGQTTIDAFRTLVLDGGAFRTGTLTNNGSLAFHSGTLGITGAGGFSIGTGALGGSVTLRDGALLDVVHTTLVSPGATLRIDGGSFRTALLDIPGTVRVDRGTASPDAVTVRGGGRLFVADTLAFGSAGSHSIQTNGRLTLEDSGLVTGQGTLASAGLVTGDGTIAVPFSSSGEVRAEAGETLYFASSTGFNTGRCNLQGGTLSYSQPFTNAAAGQINGYGELYFPDSPVPSSDDPSAGLNNHGQMNLSGGDSLIFGTVAMHTGSRLIAGGGATVVFFDVFQHTGAEVKARAGSTLVFFGEVHGPGNFTDTGTVCFEGGYSPGASPASVSIAPEMLFMESNVLTMELGGTVAGTEHDKLTFTSAAAAQVTWGGTLAVEFINGYTPAAGHSFDLFDFDAARDAGAFATLTLPSLPAGLRWDTTQLYSTGVISIMPEGLAFSAWAATVLGNAAATPGGDHDSDGFTNAAEFALGLFPPQPGTVLPGGGLHQYPDGERLRVWFTRPLDRTGVTLRIQAGSDLTNWTDLAVSVDSAAFTGAGFVSENRAHPLNEPGMVEVRDILTTTTPLRQIRLLITIAP